MKRVDLNRIIIPLLPSVTDPAHLVRFYIPTKDIQKQGLTTYTENAWIGLYGNKCIRLTIRILSWLIKKHLNKYAKKGTPLV